MLFFAFLFIGIFLTNIKLVIFCYIICYFLTIKNFKIKEYHNIVAKYFYFLIGIFLSYFLIALIKKDIFIFIENLKYSILLSIKILLILLANFYFKNKIDILPNFISLRINFLMNIFNEINDEIKNYMKNYSNKRKIIFNLDNFIADIIITTIKPYIEISKKLR